MFHFRWNSCFQTPLPIEHHHGYARGLYHLHLRHCSLAPSPLATQIVVRRHNFAMCFHANDRCSSCSARAGFGMPTLANSQGLKRGVFKLFLGIADPGRLNCASPPVWHSTLPIALSCAIGFVIRLFRVESRVFTVFMSYCIPN